MVSSSQAQPARFLDHCVLPTASLAAARKRLDALGFTVAPDAAHPFGTGNCCIFFADGSYLEPLAVLDEALAKEAAAEGNVFVARDALFRSALGEEGFSALVLGSGDAAADHAAFVAAGISAGAPLSFSRPFTDAAGREAVASFKLAFAAPGEREERFFFTCQRVNSPKGGRSGFERHANGVKGIARILAVAPTPDAYRDFFAGFSGSRPTATAAGGIDLRLSNAGLSVMTPAGFDEAIAARQSAHGGGLDLAGILFQVPALATLRTLLSAGDVLFAEHAGRIGVPPAEGQGATFIFEESFP
ncbi:VOC family protein [Nitratireductor sp. ZSWI3]|uniref:VOC family protein n=1 Tax=Nitratireductor sp. ZSWI3 TaxID=2966359 RepID=UPI00215026D5|nr:VOC family protein [Nitratireductor sp. ZSWI3]MCR4268824.1 VOC family protein [Nitratireductor sp. ZSWI3]